jgi:hypothetical protein
VLVPGVMWSGLPFCISGALRVNAQVRGGGGGRPTRAELRVTCTLMEVCEGGVRMQYNGCKWKGCKLRVEEARPAFGLRLQREWADGARDEQRGVAAAAEAVVAAQLPPLDPITPLLLPSRDTRKVRGSERAFEHAGLRCDIAARLRGLGWWRCAVEACLGWG